MSFFGNLVNAIPVVGHVKGVIHYIAGDEEGKEHNNCHLNAPLPIPSPLRYNLYIFPDHETNRVSNVFRYWWRPLERFLFSFFLHINKLLNTIPMDNVLYATYQYMTIY